jgi:hypothetical protein
MSYFIDPAGEDRCLFLSHEGQMPAAELLAARRETDAIMDQRQWRRLVVDVTHLQSLPRTSEIINFASGLSSTVSRARRVALLVRPDQEHQARLFEKLARRGRVFLAYFLDPNKATLWVNQSTPDRQMLGRGRKEKV